MQHPPALERQEVMFPGGLHGGHPIAVKALRDALWTQPRLRGHHANKILPDKGRGEARGVSVADVTFGHLKRWWHNTHRKFFAGSYGALIRGWFHRGVPPLAAGTFSHDKESDMRVPTKMAAIVAALTMALGAGVAVAHGGGPGGAGGPAGGPERGGGPGGHGGPGGGPFGAIGCEIPASQLIPVASNRQLRNYKAFLDEEVADGVMTQARANRLLSRAQKAASLRKIMKETSMAPVAKVLGFGSVAELEAAMKDKHLDEIADDKNVTDEALRKAFNDGRTVARAKMDELCGTDG